MDTGKREILKIERMTWCDRTSRPIVVIAELSRCTGALSIDYTATLDGCAVRLGELELSENKLKLIALMVASLQAHPAYRAALEREIHESCRGWSYEDAR